MNHCAHSASPLIVPLTLTAVNRLVSHFLFVSFRLFIYLFIFSFYQPAYYVCKCEPVPKASTPPKPKPGSREPSVADAARLSSNCAPRTSDVQPLLTQEPVPQRDNRERPRGSQSVSCRNTPRTSDRNEIRPGPNRPGAHRSSRYPPGIDSSPHLLRPTGPGPTSERGSHRESGSPH